MITRSGTRPAGLAEDLRSVRDLSLRREWMARQKAVSIQSFPNRVSTFPLRGALEQRNRHPKAGAGAGFWASLMHFIEA
jgi:hypothetical protein